MSDVNTRPHINAVPPMKTLAHTTTAPHVKTALNALQLKTELDFETAVGHVEGVGAASLGHSDRLSSAS